MKTGDTVRDGQGNAYQVGNLLGRGLWGKTFLVRRESNDQILVLKVPLAPDDLRGDTPAPESFFAACRECLVEQARLYEQGQLPFMPKLEARFTTPDGQPAMLLPRMTRSLQTRVEENLPLSALIDVLVAVAQEVRQLAQSGLAGGAFHGNLRPSNVLFNERGDVFLSDVATPAVRRNIVALAHVAPGGASHLPPEFTADVAFAPVADTWGIAAMLWAGVMLPASAAEFPRRGLDKMAVGALKDRVLDRMKAEDSNPRFHGRLAERVGVLLSRSLSLETAPSPPFRFARLDEFAQRIDEIGALIRPQVTQVGKVMHDRPAVKPYFDTDEVVAFSCTVGASAGVEGNEEIGVGIAVFDARTDARLKDLDLGYTSDKHPTGRYRFAFRVAGLVPGRYRVRVAFAIRDSGQSPVTAETEVAVRAAPGWVPPPEPPREAALAFTRETTGLTTPRVDSPPTVEVGSPPAPPEATPQAMPPPASPSPTPAREAVPPARPTVDPGVPGLLSGRNSAPPAPGAVTSLRGGTVSTLPEVPEPTPLHIPRPILPDDGAPLPAAPRRSAPVVEPPAAPPPRAPIASPVPPPPAASVGDGEPPAAKLARNWTFEPIPRATPTAPGEDPPSQASALDDEPIEPGPLDRAWAALRADPYVLIMSSIGAALALLVVVYLALRS